MHRPPEPHYTFTIPSIHDDTTLACRIYHPDVLSNPPLDRGETSWRKRGIVMAHPYATMGGSYDDRIVGIVIDEFLKAGWIVGTFNFRGAHGSKGRTSWSGRPELDDYSSYAAFFMHYMSYLHPFPTPDATFLPEMLSATPQTHIPEPVDAKPVDAKPVIVLGGYSYGSLILKHLPPVPTILQPFVAPLPGSSADEILLRARKLSDQSNLEWINQARDEERARQKRKAHEHKPSMTMGGEETSPEKRRSSRDIRRSMDGNRSLRLKSHLSLSHRRRSGETRATPHDEGKGVVITMPEVRYLLISPLTPPTSTFLAPSLSHNLWHKSREDGQEVIGKHATLAIYGDQDGFSSAKRLREWSEAHKAESGSQFSSVEIAGAGHFWAESGVEERMRMALREWEVIIR